MKKKKIIFFFRFLRLNSELNDKATGKILEIPWNFSKFLINN
jgi:glutathione peroxidase-family protein